MGKATAQKTIGEQLNEQLTETPATATPGMDHTVNAQASTDELFYNADAPLTASLIEARIFGAMEAIQLAFTDKEVRYQGSNGRLYRLDRPLPDGVSLDDTETVVNRLEWKCNDMLSAFVNKCERALDNEEERIAAQQKKLAAVIRQESVGRATQQNIDFETNKLESMIEQASVTLAAFRAAYQAYGDLTGHEYETKAMRQERERLQAKAPTATNGDSRVSNLMSFKLRG